MRVGARLAKLTAEDAPALERNVVTPAVIVGLDGGYVRSRHRQPERNFEVIAGKVIDPYGTQHRFAFARNGGSVAQFADALVRAGVREGTPATVLSDVTRVYGICSGRRCLARRSCWTGFTSPCVLSMSWSVIS